MFIMTAKVLLVQYLILITFFMVYGIFFKDFKLKPEVSIKDKFLFAVLIGIISSVLILLNHYILSNSPYIIYAATLNILFLLSVTLFGDLLALFFMISTVLITRVLLDGLTEKYLIYLVVLIIIGISIRLVNQLFNFKNLKQWLIGMSIVEFGTIGYLIYEHESFIFIMYYVLFMFTLQLFSYLMTKNIISFNNQLKEYNQTSKLDYLSNVYNGHEMNNIYHRFLQTNKDMTIVFITIDNFKTIRTKFRFSIFHELIKKVGQLILNHILTKGVMGKINTDEFCIIYYTKCSNLSEQLNLMEEKIENLIQYYANINHVDVNIKLSAKIIEIGKESKFNSLFDIKNQLNSY